MKRMMWAGALLSGVVASGCVIRDVNVGNDDGSGQAGGGGGAPPDTPWGCLDEEPTPPTSDVVNLQFEVVGATTRAPITTASVRACSRFDPECANPISLPVKVDAAGRANIPVPQNFTGYLEVYNGDAPSTDDPDLVPTLVYFPPREIARGADGRGIAGFRKAELQNLAGLSGGSFDGTTGFVVLVATDCQSQLAANVSYDLLTKGQVTSATRQFYTIDRVPVTSVVLTDASGTGGFTNLLPGVASFSATLVQNAQGRDITPEGGTSVFVRPGWYTQIYVAP